MRLPRAPLPMALLLCGAPLPAQIKITKTADLRFGTLVSGAGTGRLILDPDGRVQEEGLFLGSREPRGPATFLLEGPPNQPFTVEVATPVLIPTSKGHLELERFRPALPAGHAALAFNGHGQAELRVGATLKAPGATGAGALPSHPMELKVTCDGSSALAVFDLQGRIMLPLQVRAAATLEFGRCLVPGSESLVSLDPASGARKVDKGNPGILIGKGGAPGRFQIEGEPLEKVSIELPAPTQKWFLRGPGEPVEIFNFRTDPAPEGLYLDAAGNGALRVGATLRLNRNQGSGTYEGYYTVVFNYP